MIIWVEISINAECKSEIFFHFETFTLDATVFYLMMQDRRTKMMVRKPILTVLI